MCRVHRYWQIECTFYGTHIETQSFSRGNVHNEVLKVHRGTSAYVPRWRQTIRETKTLYILSSENGHFLPVRTFGTNYHNNSVPFQILLLLRNTSKLTFYPRDAMLARVIAIATCLSVCLSVRLSVCPSVTRRYCVKTKKASGMISSPSGSPKTLVF